MFTRSRGGPRPGPEPVADERLSIRLSGLIFTRRVSGLTTQTHGPTSEHATATNSFVRLLRRTSLVTVDGRILKSTTSS
jgi:hypothetical protein